MIRQTIAVTAVALALAAPAAAQDKPASPVLDQFKTLCDATNASPDAVKAAASAAGYDDPPPGYENTNNVPNLTVTDTLWRAGVGGIYALTIGVMPVRAVPGMTADVCMVVALPPEDGALEALDDWAGVPLAKTGNSPGYFYEQRGRRHQRLDKELPRVQYQVMQSGQSRIVIPIETARANGAMMMRPRP